MTQKFRGTPVVGKGPEELEHWFADVQKLEGTGKPRITETQLSVQCLQGFRRDDACLTDGNLQDSEPGSGSGVHDATIYLGERASVSFRIPVQQLQT